jgi:hypothetical protein
MFRIFPSALGPAVVEAWLAALDAETLAAIATCSVIAVLGRDAHRAGGLAAWAQEILVAVEAWTGFFDRRRARRQRFRPPRRAKS